MKLSKDFGKRNLNFRIIRYYIDRETLLNSMGNVTKGKKKKDKGRGNEERERRAKYVYIYIKVHEGKRGWFYEDSNFMATRPEGRTLFATWPSRLGIPCESRPVSPPGFQVYHRCRRSRMRKRDTVSTIRVNSLPFYSKIVFS